ncbi:MAG: zinc-binding dehydrogenase, partial [Stackebrandtia sp.]
MSQLALVAAPDAPASVALSTIDEPTPATDQVVVDVRHISVNFGEMWYAETIPAGTVMGYDAAGVVTAAAEDGSGPAVGTE